MTDIELIAEFHGWKHFPSPKGKGKGHWDFQTWGKAQWNSEFFEYHKNWSWLMPVVEKIESMGYKTTLFCHEYGKEDGNSMHIKDGSHTMLGDGFASTKIEAVYKAVVEFVKWYSENKKA